MAEEWQDQLRRFLISGGLGGREQSRIMAVLSTRVYADRVLLELNGLRAEGKVQKFNLPGKGRGTVVVWRATSEILKPTVDDDGEVGVVPRWDSGDGDPSDNE